MSHTIEKVPDAPIVILTVKSNQIMLELEAFDSALTATLDAQPEPVFLVIDMTGVEIGLDDLTIGANAVSRGPGARLHHPNVRENLMVTRDGMLKLAVMGLRTATFGNVKIKSFNSTRQAIEYCHERIAQKVGR